MYCNRMINEMFFTSPVSGFNVVADRSIFHFTVAFPLYLIIKETGKAGREEEDDMQQRELRAAGRIQP